MKPGEWLLSRFSGWEERVALIENDVPVTYKELLRSVALWKSRLLEQDCGPGCVLAFESDFGLASISLLLASIELNNIVAPLSPGMQGETGEFLRIAEARRYFAAPVDRSNPGELLCARPANPLTRKLLDAQDPGMIIFSSGSTGTPKAILHNLSRFLTKFQKEKPALRSIAVPPMDHIAGLDTMFHSLSCGGTLVCPASRRPDVVCHTIAKHRVELLPCSAGFLNLMLASQAHEHADLSSLRLVAYGSDVMPEATLSRLRAALPQVTLLQKYGTTEFGSPSTKSKDSNSVWLKIDDAGFRSKIVDGVLWIKSDSAMMGYLNAPSPIEEDGWINTGDAVEAGEDGFVRILGRRSEMINVGGHKVYPAEVETVLLQLSNVEDAVVYGKSMAIMGQIVAAKLRLKEPEDIVALKRRVREFCRERLATYKIPIEIQTADGELLTARQKKIRTAAVAFENG
jgi:acyl-CoA synthetase (AMP-forming)/AMP-acid ligase II